MNSYTCALVATLIGISSVLQPRSAEAQVAFKPQVVKPPTISRVQPGNPARASRVRPYFIPNLAAIRMNGMTMNYSQALKARNVKKHVKGLTGSKAVAQLGALSSTSDLALENESLVGFPTLYVVPESKPQRITAAGVIAWSNNGAQLTADESGSLKMSEGEIVLRTTSPISLSVDDTTLDIKEGTVILLENSDTFRCVNLYDTKRNAITIRAGTREVNLKPATECMIGEGAIETSPDCARRHQEQFQIGTTKVCICSVSIPSVIQNHRLVRYLYNSEDKHERKIGSDLLHMAACLAHCNRSDQLYRF